MSDLRQILKRVGLTQKDLARLLGMGYDSLRNGLWKGSKSRGVHKPRLWAKAFVLGYELGYELGKKDKDEQ